MVSSHCRILFTSMDGASRHSVWEEKTTLTARQQSILLRRSPNSSLQHSRQQPHDRGLRGHLPHPPIPQSSLVRPRRTLPQHLTAHQRLSLSRLRLLQGAQRALRNRPALQLPLPPRLVHPHGSLHGVAAVDAPGDTISVLWHGKRVLLGCGR